MSVSGVSGQASLWANTSTDTTTTRVSGHGHGHHGGHGAIASAAKALNMSEDDVVSALQNGQSLDDLASQQGVSHDDLVSAIKAGMPQGLASSGKADDIAEKIVSRRGLPQGPQGPQGPPPPPPSSADGSGVLSGSLNSDQQSLVDKLADLLGTTGDDLVSQLQSGASLSDLLSAQGISSDSLAGVVQGSLYVDTTA